MKEQFGGFVRTSSSIWDKKTDKSKYDKSIVFIEDTKQIYTHGNYYGTPLDSISHVMIKYSELLNLKISNSLAAGTIYEVIDYKTVKKSIILDNITEQYDDNEDHHIITKALNTSSLDCKCRSVVYVGGEVKYETDVLIDFDDYEFSDNEFVINGIYWMRDEFGNEAPYDFKHIIVNGFYTFGEDTDLSLNGYENGVYNNKIMRNPDSKINGISISEQNTYGNTFYPSCSNCRIDFAIQESFISKSESGLHIFNPKEFITPTTVQKLYD